MAQKEVLITINGISYIEVDNNEMIINLHGMALCDSCCMKMPLKGFLIPVLNSVYCRDCFNEWSNRAKHYEEDKDYEEQKTKLFLKALNENL